MAEKNSPVTSTAIREPIETKCPCCGSCLSITLNRRSDGTIEAIVNSAREQRLNNSNKNSVHNLSLSNGNNNNNPSNNGHHHGRSSSANLNSNNSLLNIVSVAGEKLVGKSHNPHLHQGLLTSGAKFYSHNNNSSSVNNSHLEDEDSSGTAATESSVSPSSSLGTGTNSGGQVGRSFAPLDTPPASASSSASSPATAAAVAAFASSIAGHHHQHHNSLSRGKSALPFDYLNSQHHSLHSSHHSTGVHSSSASALVAAVASVAGSSHDHLNSHLAHGSSHQMNANSVSHLIKPNSRAYGHSETMSGLNKSSNSSSNLTSSNASSNAHNNSNANSSTLSSANYLLHHSKLHASASNSSVDHLALYDPFKSSLNSQQSMRYKCEMNGCGQAFINTQQLELHYKEHKGEKIQKCDWYGCNRLFSSKEKLRNHIRCRHTGERPFKCTDCEKAFTSAKHLKDHRLLHTDERPFECEWEGCGLKFRRRHHLVAHKRVHTKERPYSCSFAGCEMKFTKSHHVKRHYETHFKYKGLNQNSSTVSSNGSSLMDHSSNAAIANSLGINAGPSSSSASSASSVASAAAAIAAAAAASSISPASLAGTPLTGYVFL